MLGSRQLGSFQLASGTPTGEPGGPSPTHLYVETDALLASPVPVDAELATNQTDADLVVIETDVELVVIETDAALYL